jgi:hypothetical protein
MKLTLDVPHEALVEAVSAALCDPKVLDALRAAIASPSASHEPRFATLQAYAARLCVSQRSIRNWIARGLPSMRMGSVLRIPVNEADRWLLEGGHVRKAVQQTARKLALRSVS